VAETYKGLTIRIGGDTSRLEGSLKAARRAANETARDIRKIGKAFQADPGALGSYEKQLKLMRNRAEDLSVQLGKTNEKMGELGKAGAVGSESGKTIAELSEQTRNASLNASLARERYNKLNEALASTYRPINKAARASEDFAAQWRAITGKTFDSSSWKAQEIFKLDDGQFDAVVGKLRELDGVTDRSIDKIVAYREAWRESYSDLENANAVKQLQDMELEAGRLGGELRQVSSAIGEMGSRSVSSRTFDDVNEKVGSLNDRIAVLKSRASDADAALRLDPSNVEATRSKAEALSEAEGLAKAKADALREAIKDIDASAMEGASRPFMEIQDDLRAANDEVTRLTAELSEANGRASDLESAIKGATQLKSGETNIDKLKNDFADAKERASELTIELEKAGQRAEELGDEAKVAQLKEQLGDAADEASRLKLEMQKSGKVDFSWSGLRDVGHALSGTVTAAAKQFGSYAIQSAEETDSAYRDMRKTVQGTEEQFEDLRKSAIEFSNTHVTSASELLGIQAIGGELGIAVENLDTFSKTVSNISIATDLGTEEAATGLGHLSNIMSDLDAGTMPKFGDALVRLGNNGAATESQIMDISTRVAAIGSVYGMTTPQILAWSSTIAATGQKSESAGTAIANTISDIGTAVATGGDKLEKLASVSGMSAGKFKESWGKDASGTFEAFVKGLSKSKNADKDLEELGVTGAKQKQALLGLMQTIGGLDDNLKMSGDAWNGVSDKWGAAGDAASEADKKAEGLSGSLSKLRNMSSNLGSELGEASVPYVGALSDAVQGLTGWFSGLSDESKTAAVGIGGFAAALGPSLVFVAEAGEGIEKLGKMTPGIKDKFGKLADKLVDCGSSAKDVATGFVTQSAAFKKASSGASALSQKFPKLSARMAGAKGAVSSWVSGLSVFKESALAGSFSVGVIAASVAALGTVVYEATKHTTTMGSVTKRLDEQLARAKGLDTYTGAVEGIGKAAEDASPNVFDMQSRVDKLDDSLVELADNMEQRNAAAEENIANLELAKGTIEEFAGKTDLTASEQLRLDEAIKTVNDALGLNISSSDVAKNSYKDQNGEVRNLCDSLDQLVAKKKLSYKVDALAEDYKDAYKKQRDAQKDVAAATDDVTKAQENLNAAREKYGNSKNPVDQSKIDVAANKLRTAKDNLESTKESAGKLDDAMKELDKELERATWESENYNKVPIVDKKGNVDINDASLITADGRIVHWNGETWVDEKNSKVNVNDAELTDAQGNVWVWNGTKLVSKSATAKTSGDATDGTAKKKVDETSSSITNLKGKDVDVKAKVSGKDDVLDLGKAILNLPNAAFSWVKAVTGIGKAAGGIRPHADGGIVRRHANGAVIANRPGPGIPLDVVGEAGAEAIVPLTNRRYTQPFVDMIADGVIDRLDAAIDDINARNKVNADALVSVADALEGSTSVTNVNTYFDGITVNSSEEIRAAFVSLMYAVKRFGDMNHANN
jgi:TP901 family phage tail tape measure protein